MKDHPETHFLFQQATECLIKYPGSWLLEIGCLVGDTTRALAEAVGSFPAEELSVDSRVVVIDPFYGHYDEGLVQFLIREGHGDSGFIPFCKNLGEYRDLVIPIATTTENANALLDQLDPRFSFAFVDGWHSEEGAYSDLQSASRWLLPGGAIFVHDAYWEGVKAAVDRFCYEEPKAIRTSHCPEGSGGTGAIDRIIIP
jgi:hypothetical protein